MFSTREERGGKFPLIGVEPVMFLYMSAFMTTAVVEESFFIFKACRANLGFPANVCHNINDKAYKNYSSLVQVHLPNVYIYLVAISFYNSI